MPKLILIRGMPGSGKSTYAEKLCEEKKIFIWTEADNYWIRPDGLYDFNIKHISEAHAWCLKKTRDWMSRGIAHDVAVANTFTRMKEMKKYIELAEELNYDLEVHRMVTQFENIHDVPEKTLENMKKRFEDYEGEILIGEEEDDKSGRVEDSGGEVSTVDKG